MNDLLLIEKSKFAITPSENNSYVLEGVFTEFGLKNRNGRIYTKEEFMPHFKELKKVVEAGTCVGELDHPKQFETMLQNVSHKIEEVWIDENQNCVKGRIKLLDTDAGKNAKALVDAGVPLHISSRAAGTVTENKTVKIHKLFTYDLVDTPGFANARLNSVNESYGFDSNEDESDFIIYEVQGKHQFAKEVNNKNNKEEKMDYISEQQFEDYSLKTKNFYDNIKQEIEEIKEIQESIIEQSDEIVDVYNSNKIVEKLSNISKRLEKLEEMKTVGLDDGTTSYNVGDVTEYGTVRAIDKSEGKTLVYFDDEDEPMVLENNTSKNSNDIQGVELQEKLDRLDILEAKFEAMEKWSNHVTKTVSAIEDWSEEATINVNALKEWSNEATTTVSAIENWTEEATTNVNALKEWSNEATTTVSAIENWSEEVTTNVKALKEWSEHTTDSVTRLEEGKIITVNESNESMDDFTKSIYNKIDAIIETKEQKVESTSLNESNKQEELLEENEQPLWLQLIPSKYKETWNGLDENEKNRISNRANLFEFKSESSIRNFWSVQFSKENLIKEESNQEVNEIKSKKLLETRQERYIKGYRDMFGK